MFEYLRNCVLALSCVALPALACTPSSEYKPPSVEQIFAAVTYVVYAEAIAYEESVDGRRAQVSVIEQFKGPPVKSIGASGQGCGLSHLVIHNSGPSSTVPKKPFTFNELP